MTPASCPLTYSICDFFFNSKYREGRVITKPRAGKTYRNTLLRVLGRRAIVNNASFHWSRLQVLAAVTG